MVDRRWTIAASDSPFHPFWKNRCRPVSEVRRDRYRCCEPGVRALVRAVDRAGLVPVWSCQGHKHRALPPKWLSSPVLARFRKAGIAWWRRPFVIVFRSGSSLWAETAKSRALREVGRAAGLVTTVRVTRAGCSITRALPPRLRRTQATALTWVVIMQLGSRQLETARRALLTGPRGLSWSSWCLGHGYGVKRRF